MNKNKLNGWYRLWVVLSVLWILGILFSFFAEADGTMSKYKKKINQKEYEQFLLDTLPVSTEEVVTETTDRPIKKRGKESYEEFLERVSRIQAENEKQEAEREKQVKKEVLIGLFLVCIVPPLIVLLSGLSIVWVLSGFNINSLNGWHLNGWYRLYIGFCIIISPIALWVSSWGIDFMVGVIGLMIGILFLGHIIAWVRSGFQSNDNKELEKRNIDNKSI